MNALLVALFKATQQELDAYRILSLNARTSLEMGISYTGAFDDASASLLGGFVVTNNPEMKLLKRNEVEGEAVILIPPWRRGKVSLEEIRKDVKLVEMAVKEAIDGNYRLAMIYNSQHYCRVIGYTYEPVEKAVRLGVSAGLSGNGPTYVAFGSKDEMNEIETIWSEYGEIVRTELVTEPAEDVRFEL
jgi:shikimate kinase